MARQLELKCESGSLRFDLSLVDNLQLAEPALPATAEPVLVSTQAMNACKVGDPVAQAVSPRIRTE